MSRCSQHSRDEHPASIVYSFLLQHGVISLSLKPGNANTGGGGEVAAVARGITSLGGDFCGGGGGDGVLCSCRGGCEGGGGVGGGGWGGVYLLLEGTGEASRLILWIEEGRGVVEVK
jgi:hypothetical protein